MVFFQENDDDWDESGYGYNTWSAHMLDLEDDFTPPLAVDFYKESSPMQEFQVDSEDKVDVRKLSLP